jgi:hypothetical protein
MAGRGDRNRSGDGRSARGALEPSPVYPARGALGTNITAVHRARLVVATLLSRR